MRVVHSNGAVEPLERSQLVWRRALALARKDPSHDHFVESLGLLRAARHGPSTLRHALTLGRAEQQAAPDDIPTRDAVQLLERTVAWLGAPVDRGEVGTAGSR
jgi:hypothetical protein